MLTEIGRVQMPPRIVQRPNAWCLARARVGNMTGGSRLTVCESRALVRLFADTHHLVGRQFLPRVARHQGPQA